MTDKEALAAIEKELARSRANVKGCLDVPPWPWPPRSCGRNWRTRAMPEYVDGEKVAEFTSGRAVFAPEPPEGGGDG